MYLWWDTAPPGFMKMIADPFCKSTVCNGHLSVWSVRIESRCAALQEVQGGSSYLTCTVDGLQLTERCHFQQERSVPDCKQENVSQGQRSGHTCVWLVWPGILGQIVTHGTSLYTVQVIKLFAYLEDRYNEHCSVILTIHPCWKCR